MKNRLTLIIAGSLIFTLGIAAVSVYADNGNLTPNALNINGLDSWLSKLKLGFNFMSGQTPNINLLQFLNPSGINKGDIVGGLKQVLILVINITITVFTVFIGILKGLLDVILSLKS